MGRLDYLLCRSWGRLITVWVSGRSILSEQPYPIIGADLKKNGHGLYAFLDVLQILAISSRLKHGKGSQLLAYSWNRAPSLLPTPPVLLQLG
jgi:hypothetical protein